MATGWKTAQAAAAALVLLQLIDAGRLAGDPPAPFRSGAGAVGLTLFTLGWLALCGLALYGTWLRSRWGAWLGGVLAGLGVVLLPLSMLGAVQIGSVELAGAGAGPLEGALTWLQVAANAAFLVGLALVRRGRQGR